MKASTPIGPSLGLNAVRLSILSGAVTAALGAPAMAQESMEIELDPFEHTVFVPGEDTRDVLVTGVKTATITAGFNNVLIASRVEQETTFRLQGFGVSNALTGVSLVLPAGKGPVNVLASGGTTTIVMDTSNLPEDDGQDGGSGNENPDEDLGDLGGFRLLSDENQADYSDGQFKAGAKLVHAFANGGRAALETVGRNPQDVLVIAGHLHVTPDVQMSFGVEGSEETNANFHLGPSAGVVINKSWFMGLAEDKGAITFGKGTKAAPFNEETDPVQEAKALVLELEKYDPALAAKPRWIVLNKIDLVEEADRDALIERYRSELAANGEPIFVISAATRQGCEELVKALAQRIDDDRREEVAFADDTRFDPAEH